MKHVGFTEIKTKRLLLRKIRSEDMECYYSRISSSEDVAKYMLWQPHRSKQDVYAAIQKVIARYEDDHCYSWGIALSDDDSLIGRIDLLRFDESNSSCSFAYMLGKDFWGCGYGTEALTAVLSFAFEKMEMKCVIADHMRENIASGKVMQKAGMKFVRSYASKYEKNGIHYDADEYMITADDWAKKQ